jgi:putative phage-type endonuclease
LASRLFDFLCSLYIGNIDILKEGDAMAIVLTSTEGLPYEDWLAFRRLGIGGSDASVVCGINKYKASIELWMEKTGQMPHQEAGEAAYWGTRLESLVREEFTLRTGIEVSPVKQILQSEEYPFMLANLDGECQHPNYGSCVFEAKTAGAYVAKDWDDGIPDAYMLQIQHYMAVTGFQGAYIAVLIGGNTFKWKFVERDEELISMLIRLEAEYATCELLAKYTEQKQEAENLLKQMIGDNEVGIARDWVITWKSISQERLDCKTLKAEHPALHKKYANTISYRRFSVSAAV